MTKYILLDIVSYNVRKKNEYDKYRLKEFTMQNRLLINENVELDFGKDKIKSKLVSVVKDSDTLKTFVLDTKSFTAIIQVAKYYNQNVTNE